MMVVGEVDKRECAEIFQVEERHKVEHVADVDFVFAVVFIDSTPFSVGGLERVPFPSSSRLIHPSSPLYITPSILQDAARSH